MKYRKKKTKTATELQQKKKKTNAAINGWVCWYMTAWKIEHILKYTHQKTQQQPRDKMDSF